MCTFCIYLYMYTEKSARLENQLSIVVTSRGWVLWGREKDIPFTLHYTLKCCILWAWPHFSFSKKGKKPFKGLLPSVSCSNDPLERRLEKDSTTVHFFLYLQRISRRGDGKWREKNNNNQAHFHLTFISVTITPKSHQNRTLNPKISGAETTLLNPAHPAPSTGILWAFNPSLLNKCMDKHTHNSQY